MYDCYYKLMVDGKEVPSITKMDYAQIRYKVERKGKGNGYCVLSKYPFPRKETITVFGILNGDLIYFRRVRLSPISGVAHC